MRLGFEGSRDGAAPHEGGGAALLRALLVRASAAAGLRRGVQAARLDGAPLAALARPRQLPGSSVAPVPAAQRADPEGAYLRARRGRCSPRPRPRCRRRPGGRAQLGLPLQLDPRLDVHALGALHPRASTGRRTTSSTSSPTSRAARRTCRSCTGSAASASSPSATLDHLSGYEGARPVRIGNDAYKQNQHDVWGALLDSVYLHTRSRDSLRRARLADPQHARSRLAIANWREPDRGIWEVRGEPKHFTSSKMFCWVACDRGARLAEIRDDLEHAQRWQDGRRRDPRRHLRARSRRARRLRPALRHDGARRGGAADAAAALPAGPATSASARPCSRSPTS